MKKNLDDKSTNKEEKEIKYIKKFNRKLKLLRNILLIILVLFVLVVGRKTIILTSLSNKANEIKDEKNYYIKLESYSEGQMNILETYYKDNKSYATMTIYSKENNIIKMTSYKNGQEKIGTIQNGDKKILSNNGDITVQPIFFAYDNILENLIIAITTNIEKVNLNGTECYMIKDGNTEKFIDANTGLAIKMIDNRNNRTVDYKYEYGTVKDSDIIKPDTTGYIVIE